MQGLHPSKLCSFYSFTFTIRTRTDSLSKCNSFNLENAKGRLTWPQSYSGVSCIRQTVSDRVTYNVYGAVNVAQTIHGVTTEVKIQESVPQIVSDTSEMLLTHFRLYRSNG